MYQSESCQLTLGGQSLEHFETLYGSLPSSVEGHRHCIHEVETHIYRMCGDAVCACAYGNMTEGLLQHLKWA